MVTLPTGPELSGRPSSKGTFFQEASLGTPSSRESLPSEDSWPLIPISLMPELCCVALAPDCHPVLMLGPPLTGSSGQVSHSRLFLVEGRARAWRTPEM